MVGWRLRCRNGQRWCVGSGGGGLSGGVGNRGRGWLASKANRGSKMVDAAEIEAASWSTKGDGVAVKASLGIRDGRGCRRGQGRLELWGKCFRAEELGVGDARGAERSEEVEVASGAVA